MSEIIELTVKTNRREEMIEITGVIQKALQEKGVANGICHIFVPHTTCGLTINEHADPDVVHDIIATLDKMVPFEGNYRHMEGNSPAHVKASLVGSSQTVMIAGGKLCLGTWQGIFLCEFDGPRQRRVWLKIMSDA
ncbi:MAG TPA: YjbQ family protein [Syntrophomonadaceae bacterium]|nr:YjbQ family protein [Syntrophomonadaceae bacterium]